MSTSLVKIPVVILVPNRVAFVILQASHQPRLVRSLHVVGKYVELRCRKDVGVVRTWGKGNVVQDLDTQHKQPRESGTWKLHACIKLKTNHAIYSIIENSAVVFGKRNRKSVFEIWSRRAYVRSITSNEEYLESYDTQR